MPIKINLNGNEDWFYPTSDWKSISFKNDILSVNVDRNFYVEHKKI